MTALAEYLSGWECREYSTVNGWGFGGSIGHSYAREGVRVLLATAYYRHLNSQSFITVTTEDGRIFDEEYTAQNQKACLELLKELER